MRYGRAHRGHDNVRQGQEMTGRGYFPLSQARKPDWTSGQASGLLFAWWWQTRPHSAMSYSTVVPSPV